MVAAKDVATDVERDVASDVASDAAMDAAGDAADGEIRRVRPRLGRGRTPIEEHERRVAAAVRGEAYVAATTPRASSTSSVAPIPRAPPAPSVTRTLPRDGTEVGVFFHFFVHSSFYSFFYSYFYFFLYFSCCFFFYFYVLFCYFSSPCSSSSTCSSTSSSTTFTFTTES